MDYGKLCSKCSYATENIYSEIGTPAQELTGIALVPLLDTQIKFLIKVPKFMEMLCSGEKKNTQTYVVLKILPVLEKMN